jgi:pseudouridine-5'-phosphate glycosidase
MSDKIFKRKKITQKKYNNLIAKAVIKCEKRGMSAEETLPYLLNIASKYDIYDTKNNCNMQ